MSRYLFFRGDALVRETIKAVTEVTSTVSGRFPFFFCVVTSEKTHFYFFPTWEEAHHERTRLLALL